MEKITKIETFKQIKEIIEPIPADQFCAGTFENWKGQCCFFGHIQKYISGDACLNREGFGARQLTRTFLLEVHNIYHSWVDGSIVNNSNTVNGYTEPIIKDRLMHMIEDGIKWEESKDIFLE